MNTNEVNNQVLVVNIKYGKQIDNRRHKERPEMTVLDLPDHIMNLSKHPDKFYDAIESFAYNTVTKRFGAECSHCQVYLTF